MTRVPTAEDWAPASCTLPTVEQPLRLAEFDKFFKVAALRSTRTSTTRLDLTVQAESRPTAEDLAKRETSCCSFFRFDFEDVLDGLLMRIGVPEDHVDVLDALQDRIASVAEIKTVHCNV